MSLFKSLGAGVLALFVASQAFAYRVSVWIPPWDQSALTSIQLHKADESNPVWYSWNADGSIAKNWNAENSSWRAAMTGSALLPTIQNVVNKSFDATAVQAMLSSAPSREAHAEAVFQLVVGNAFDGIDVDYERIPAASRANFTAFIQTLGAKLHGAGKKLSVTVYAKTSDVTWNGAGAEDWPAIGGAADSVKIMAYDYHWATSSAGAITPLDWLDSVVTYAEGTIAKSKIIVGLPWYGYDWSATGGSTASYASATQVALNNGVTIGRDANSEPTYTYNGHTVFFQDATSYAKKVDLIKQKHSGVAGFAHWASGVEDPGVWNVIKGNGVPTPAQPPPPAPVADFSITGPNVLTVTLGGETVGDYRVTAINGFNGTPAMTVLPSAFNGVLAPQAPLSLRVAAPAFTTPGTYQVTLRFTSGSLVHDALVTIVVNGQVRRRAAAH